MTKVQERYLLVVLLDMLYTTAQSDTNPRWKTIAQRIFALRDSIELREPMSMGKNSGLFFRKADR